MPSDGLLTQHSSLITIPGGCRDRIDQLIRPYGLYQVHIEARVERAAAVRVPPVAGERDQRDCPCVGIRAQSSGDFVAIDAREAYVYDRDVRFLGDGDTYSLETSARLQRLGAGET